MPDRFQSVLLFGAPGVGKGTQGELLGRIPGMYHMATGDMFRSLDKTSDLGKRIVEYSSKGLLVPDEVTIELWQQYMEQRVHGGDYRPATDLLVLDGIPRSINQTQAMDGLIEVLAVIHLVAPNIDDMVERMKKRALTQGRRDDADEGVIRRRFEVYQEETAPVLGHYDTGLIHDITAIGTPAQVLLNVLNVVVPIHTANFGNPL